METIKNYLDAMFRNLPQTEKVLRAKSELFQMMEDKYTELIREGKTENEAVGTIISEFGNLEDLSADLGIADVFKTTKEENINRRKIGFEEAAKYLEASKKAGILTGLGTLFCICCVIPPVLADVFNKADSLGATGLFAFIGIGVVLFILSGIIMEDFKYLKNENCILDSVAADLITKQKHDYTSSYSVTLSIGILLCVLCCIPPIIFDNKGILEELSPVLLFVFIGVGVLLITLSNTIKTSYERLLNLGNKTLNKNGTSTPSAGKKGNTEYKNPTIQFIMDIFWPTVACIYLCVSFITGSWGVTWIIWPIAACLLAILRAAFKDEAVQK